MDLGLLFGFLATWALIAWALLSSGNVGYYIDIPSAILVIGGCVTIVFFSAPAGNVLKLPRVLLRAMFQPKVQVDKLIADLVSYAEVARRNGILSLESVTKDIKDPFIVRGLQMAIDGTDPELIEQIMTAEVDNTAGRHDAAKAVFDLVGKYAPALGMIGTLVGLVVMLQNMDDPSKIGPGMAVAIITTLYGAMIANGVCLPMSDRLARRSCEELNIKMIIIKGVMSIQSGDNPRVVEQKLRTFLPPSQRQGLEQKDAA